MSKVHKLQPNYQHILDNFDALTIEDFEVTDVDADLYLKEIDLLVHNYRENGETDHPSDADPLLHNLNSQTIINSILGTGSYGSVVKYQNKAMKIFHYFPLEINFRHAAQIYKTDTHYVFSPDLFEGVCSIYINKMLQNYSDCFYNTYGVYVSGFHNIISYKDELKYIFSWSTANEHNEDFLSLPDEEILKELEKHEDAETIVITFDLLDPLPDEWYRHKIGTNDMYYILYIILHNIYILQSVCQFVHGDLHVGNILAKKHTKDIQLAYEDEIIVLPSKGYAPVMIDFGFASFEREGRRVVTTTEPLVASGSSYDQHYDVAKLLWSLVSHRYKVQQGYEDIEEIFLNRTGNSITTFIKTDDNEVNYDLLMRNKLLKPVDEILAYLLTKLQYTRKDQKLNFSKYIDGFYDIIQETRTNVKISEGITYRNIIYDTVEPYWKVTPFSRKLNVHLIEIKKANNFKFVNRCCKQTVYDMVKSREGVAINGSYFDLNTHEYIDEYNPVYIEHLGMVEVNGNGVKIQQMSNGTMTTDYNKMYKIPAQYTKYNTNTFVSNPMLVYGGKATQFDLVKRTVDRRGKQGAYLYTCEDGEVNIYDMRDPDYSSCKFIRPGELTHLGNSNPRTILATKGDITYFIVIVGRANEYTGASVEQMQDFLVNYLHVDSAINLDGGASSLMMWNIGGKVYSPLNVIHRKVVSNVVGYIKA